MQILYAILFLLALILLITYLFAIKKKKSWMFVLSVSIVIVNLGYFLLSIAHTIDFALFANKVSYLGSIGLLISMFFIVQEVCVHKIKTISVIILLSVSIFMYLMVLTTGYLPWYYKDATLEFVDNAAKLNKVYGPLYPLYLIYMAIIYILMLYSIIKSLSSKDRFAIKHAIFLLLVYTINILIWVVEKFVNFNFQFVSISYIFSEVILICLYWMMQDYIKKDQIQPEVITKTIVIDTSKSVKEYIDLIISNLPKDEILHSRELEILEAILNNKKRKDIAIELSLSENTIKTYTRSLYNKLNITSREELFNLIK